MDDDPWGKPYKIVMARLGGKKPNMVLTREQVGRVIDTLFTTSPLPPSLPRTGGWVRAPSRTP